MCAILVIACAFPVSAQTLYGTLLGNVTDDTGLAVPGATVKITHVRKLRQRLQLRVQQQPVVADRDHAESAGDPAARGVRADVRVGG